MTERPLRETLQLQHWLGIVATGGFGAATLLDLRADGVTARAMSSFALTAVIGTATWQWSRRR
jgi:hypothetical protein